MIRQDNSLTEIEIKFSATEKTLEALQNAPIFRNIVDFTWQQKELLNQYIDTADFQLTKAKVALRIRKDGDHYIQTVKSKGNSVGGFSARDEFDWYLKSPQLDTSLLVPPYWPKSLDKFDKSTLITLFSTDFIRHYAPLIWSVGSSEANIEIAIDQGTVQASDQQTKICELELELKSGSVDVMLDFALMLAKCFPLIPSNLSKAERGYRLINPEGYKQAALALTSENSLNKQLEYYLTSSQYYWESYCWQAEPSKLVNWINTLQQLNILLKKLSAGDLSSLLEPILLDWQSAIMDEMGVLPDKVADELANTRWGVFVLSVSRWLLNGD